MKIVHAIGRASVLVVTQAGLNRIVPAGVIGLRPPPLTLQNVFPIAWADQHLRIMATSRLTRAQFQRCFDNRRVALVVMDARGSAHYWARQIEVLGTPRHVRPYDLVGDVRTFDSGMMARGHCEGVMRKARFTEEQMSDAIDAAALLEATVARRFNPFASSRSSSSRGRACTAPYGRNDALPAAGGY